MEDSLEDRIRRMVLLNDSVPDDTSNTRPTVRLPPATGAYHGAQSSMNGVGSAAPPNQGYSSINSTSHAFPPTTQQHAPHFRQAAPRQHPGPSHYVQPSTPRGPPPPRQAHYGHHGVGRGNGPPRQQQQRYQQVPLDPNAFQRGPQPQHQTRAQPGVRNLYDPNGRTQPHGYVHPQSRNDFRQRQVQYLEQIAAVEISKVDMSDAEKTAKESFRVNLEKVCQEVCQANPTLPTVSLECFGSFQSGFASAGSDMDLVIVLEDDTATATCFSLLEQDLPRTLEKKLLESGFGARLLTRTRVPIIKVCQSPAPDFLDKLREEREKWDVLPDEKKYPHLHPEEQVVEAQNTVANGAQSEASDPPTWKLKKAEDGAVPAESNGSAQGTSNGASEAAASSAASTLPLNTAYNANEQQMIKSKRDQSKTWTRERKPGPLDFPHEGVGIQCDINFFNPLGLHNTQMLRCYSLCDPRVRPMVLFVKSWVKQRKINSSYSGTLSSYGYVLMVLHYLMNVVQPPVLPNLQMPWRPQGCTPSGATKTEVDGWTVDFWRNEEEITNAVRNGQMSSNRDSLGSLLAGFFQYYSSMGQGPQFRWTQQVLSLRTERGILTKEAKGWVKATTEEGEGKKIQHRYLFCIEDPFELSHNVARTVTHNGIVAIRDEFRRAYRILNSIGNGYTSNEGPLFAQLVEEVPESTEQSAKDSEQIVTKPSTPIAANGVSASKSISQTSHGVTSSVSSSAGSLPSQSRSTSALDSKADLDISSSASFPTLGSASAAGGGKKKKNGVVGNFAAIEGNAAQAYLDEYRRKKAEEQAGFTAMGAAKAVLGDD